jgi:hypothetical protein
MYRLFALLVLAAVTLSLYYRYPQRATGAEQPIPFSHRVHAGEKEISCRFCHPYVDRSRSAGLPSLQKCFYCHWFIVPLPPQLEEARKSLEQKKPVAWTRVYFVPDHVEFRHQPHIELAEIACAVCHGPVETLDRLRPASFKMGFCVDCHKRLKAPLDCWLSCHH